MKNAEDVKGVDLEELLCSLEERLVQHDNNRREVQDDLQCICTGILEDANLFEEKINEELQKSFNEKEECVLNIINKLNNNNNEENFKETIIKQSQEELSNVLEYEIQQIGDTGNLINSYELKTSSVRVSEDEYHDNIKGENDIKEIINRLHNYINRIHDSMISTQDILSEIITERRNYAEELEKKINEKLEYLFAQEDSRIQKTVSLIKERSDDSNKSIKELSTKAKMTLFKKQKYSFDNNNRELIVTAETSLKDIDFEKRNPTNIKILFTNRNVLSLSFTFFSENEINVLMTANKLHFNVEMKMWDKSQSEEDNPKIVTLEYNVGEQLIYLLNRFTQKQRIVLN